MKQSPSPRGPSPNGPPPSSWNRPGHTPSEASDTVSMGSEEGQLSLPRKKKSVKVSFDDDPHVVGLAAEPAENESPVIMSPQTKDHSKRNWFHLGRDKGRSIFSDETDDVMSPVPSLPSFGSVRGDRRPSQDDNFNQQSKPSEHREDATINEALRNLTSSSDHAVGSIIVNDFATKNQPEAYSSNDPLPPEVTSVEGSGYHSDSESSTTSTTSADAPINSNIAP